MICSISINVVNISKTSRFLNVIAVWYWLLLNSKFKVQNVSTKYMSSFWTNGIAVPLTLCLRDKLSFKRGSHPGAPKENQRYYLRPRTLAYELPYIIHS